MANEELQGTGPATEPTELTVLRMTLIEQTKTLAERDSKLCELRADKAELQAKQTKLQSDYKRLRKLYEQLREELALVKRRMFVATAERVDTSQLQLEFADLVAKMDAIAGVLPLELEAEVGKLDGDGDAGANGASVDVAKTKPKPNKSKPRGRRKLADADLPETRIELPDPLFEQLVAEGKAERIGFERSYKLGYQRGGQTKIMIERVKYRAVNAKGKVEIETAAVPKELIKRCLAAPSMLAHVSTSKMCDGLPLYRQQEILARAGASVDRGTMSRWLEDVGASFGATVIEAANKDASENAFCILTDATGFAVQPGRFDDPKNKKRRPCRKGHYFVRIADRDHILFDFVKRHNTNSVRALFKGYAGYLQADASSVYNALFRPAEPGDPEDDGCARVEVACWSHARRKYWEAALAKQIVAREALVRIGKIFELDAGFRKGNPPSKIKKLRNQHLRPLVEHFLEFAAAEYEKVKNERGSLRSALGYSVRQAEALRTFLDDGRLRLDNNPSESELRKIVRIRDASLFAGSDEHAESAGHILSMIASAKLHFLDPERYLRDIIRVLPHWPRKRFIELTAKHWAATRAKLNPAQLAAEFGHLDVPPT